MKRRTSSCRLPYRLQLRPVALSLVCMGMAPALAQVLPTFLPGMFSTQGGVTVSGVPTVTPLGGLALAIAQSSPRAIINWNGFSIGAKDAVNIWQNMGASSILLNRVTGNDPSVIAGQLNANGRVFLVTPTACCSARARA